MDFNVTSGAARRKVVSGSGGGGKGDGFSALSSRGRGSSAAAPMSMYIAPPPGIEVSIEDFEEFALDRLRVLKVLEEARARGRNVEEVANLIDELWRKHMRVPGNPQETQRKDIISHFVLRLGYCRSEELRRWFLTQECALFRFRFRGESSESQRKFLEEHGLPYKAISSAELQEVRDKLDQVARSLNMPVSSADAIYYKDENSAFGVQVPFEEVPDLVATRRVYLQRGFAYVPSEQFAAIVVGHFRANLSKALVVTNQKWMHHIREDEQERASPIIESLSSRYLGEDYSDPSARGAGQVALGDLDQLAKESFPLCMRHLFFKLREDHHLKHGGRMQLGLFLKGIGLRLEDALAFWKAEFSIKMGSDKFEKEYSYTIRHNYGKEGKRTDYTPYSCAKIITSTPGVGDHHGCPFRHFSQDNLSALLQRVGVSGRPLADILEKSRQHHFQIACGMTFGATQGQPCPSAGITHPNEYFDLSIKAKKGINLSALPKPGSTQEQGDVVPPSTPQPSRAS